MLSSVEQGRDNVSFSWRRGQEERLGWCWASGQRYTKHGLQAKKTTTEHSINVKRMERWRRVCLYCIRHEGDCPGTDRLKRCMRHSIRQDGRPDLWAKHNSHSVFIPSEYKENRIWLRSRWGKKIQNPKCASSRLFFGGRIWSRRT